MAGCDDVPPVWQLPDRSRGLLSAGARSRCSTHPHHMPAPSCVSSICLQARGLGGIPGFSYKDDAGASYAALLAYANTTLAVFYGAGGAAIKKDNQLQVRPR